MQTQFGKYLMLIIGETVFLSRFFFSKIEGRQDSYLMPHLC